MSRVRKDDLVVFLGPSLPASEASRIGRCRVMPPARQGDIWRALSLEPVAIALVDGLFEAVPSVWHHEIVDALEAGVAVFGGASMGALRAAELAPLGMVGVGTVFGWYRDGVVEDDSEVALLHAGPELGYQAFTVPLVNVRHAAAQAREARILSGAEAGALVEAAAAIHYQERSWQRVIESVGGRWRQATKAHWASWAKEGIEDLKARDARACIEAAARFVEARRASPGPSPSLSAPSTRSSLARRRRLEQGLSLAHDGSARLSGEILERLRARPDSAELTERGLRRALLAGWARELGLKPSPEELARAEQEWLSSLGIRASSRAGFLAASGIDSAQARRLCEEVALERLMLVNANRLLSDGPSADEALADEARLGGQWAAECGYPIRAKGRAGRLKAGRRGRK